jgi:hypothetical protein
MSNRDMIDQVYERLAQAPVGLDCLTSEVLAACGLFVSAILATNFSDPAARQDRLNRFCRALQACVDTTKLALRRHPLN